MTTTSTGNGEWNSVVGAYNISDDVIINHDVTYDDHIDMTGSLTINSGKTLGEGAASKNMTVDGHVSVDGTLDLDRSSSDGNATFDSIIINSGGQVDAPSHGTITILSEDASHAFRCSGGGTFNNNDGSVIIQTPAETRLKMNGTGNLHNLTVNHASCVLFMESDSSTTIEGNLTITAGEVRPHTQGNSQRTLIVTGSTEIGPSSGSADQATITCSDSPMSLGSGLTSQYGLIVQAGGTFVGGTGAHTIGGLKIANTVNAKCTLTSGVTTMNGEHASDNYIFTIEGANGDDNFSHGNGTVTITRASDSRIRNAGAALALNNLIINHASANIILASNGLTLAGDLTITAGEFGTGADKALTVTGDCIVGNGVGSANTAILDGNASAISFGSLAIDTDGKYDATSGTTTITSERSDGLAMNLDGTFTHNSGTVIITTSSNSQIDWIGSSGNLNNLTYSGGAILEWTVNGGTIDGDLSITNGTLQSSNGNKTLTVTGDVTVGDGTGSANTAILGNVSEAAAQTFGSLTIDSDGKYNATSGTTTITDESSGNYAFENQGTFTHNNGKVLIDFDTPNKNDNTDVKCNEFYDFEIKMNGTSYSTIFRDLSGNTVTFLGDLTITQGKFDDNVNADDYVIHGNTIVESNGYFGTATNWHTGDITHHGLVVLNGGTYYRSDAGGTVKMGGIRNIGGSVL